MGGTHRSGGAHRFGSQGGRPGQKGGQKSGRKNVGALSQERRPNVSPRCRCVDQGASTFKPLEELTEESSISLPEERHVVLHKIKIRSELLLISGLEVRTPALADFHSAGSAQKRRR